MIEKTSFIDTKHEGMIVTLIFDISLTYSMMPSMITMEEDQQQAHLMVNFRLILKRLGTIQIFDVSKGDLAKGDNVIKLSSFKAQNNILFSYIKAITHLFGRLLGLILNMEIFQLLAALTEK